MDIALETKILHEAGAKDSHENLLASLGKNLTRKEYEAIRTNRHMETALRVMFERVWEEGYEARDEDSGKQLTELRYQPLRQGGLTWRFH